MSRNVLILGAAGRDFHDFNTVFRNDAEARVVGFTATQIPDIADRRYPAALAGPLYPSGIPIFEEAELESLIGRFEVDEVVFSYSDVSHTQLMHVASRALAAGAGFRLLAPRETMLKASVPVVSICAARTGCGKSPASRRVARALSDLGHRVVIVRHPMPYGDLARQAVQRFETWEDLDKHEVTFEEREEYEPHIDEGRVVFAGVDYGRILEAAQAEADIVIWDGGNNDLPFFAPDLHIVIVDAHRPSHSALYHPGEANVRRADVLIINKIDTASLEQVEEARATCFALNKRAPVLEAASPLTIDGGAAIRGARVLVVEDGPTVTHGEMPFGAGWVAARRYGAAEIVDPRPWAVGSIKATFERYTHLSAVLPAMGYGDIQIGDLAATIAAAPADLVVFATPMDLQRKVAIDKPSVRVKYDLQVIGEPTLEQLLADKFGPARER